MKRFAIIFVAIILLLSGCGRKENANPINSSQIGPIVSISSSPNGASVYVNDEYEGITPCKLYLKKDAYKFTILKDGYITQEKSVEITENTDLNFTLEKPEIKGTLNDVPLLNFQMGIPYDNLYIFREQNNIECVSLKDLKVVWKKNFNNAVNFTLDSGIMYVEKQDSNDNTAVEEIFAVNPETGSTIAKEQFTLKKDGKPQIISFQGVSEGIAIFEEYLFTYGPPPYGLYLKAYSIKTHKLLYSKFFSAFPTEIPIFDEYLYLFGRYKNGFVVYKINKFTGKIVSKANFFTFSGVHFFSAAKIPSNGEKVAVHFLSNKTFTYIIDLEKQAILFRLKGNFVVQNNRYLLSFDECNQEKNLSINVIDLSSMKRVGTVSYNLLKDGKRILPLSDSYPVYERANHRIYFFLNGTLHCFNEKGKEVETAFNKSYKYLITPLSVSSYHIYIYPEKAGEGITVFTNSSSPHKVLVVDNKTLTPIFISSEEGEVLGDNLFLFNITEKGNPAKNLQDKGTVTMIDLNRFIKNNSENSEARK